MEDYIRYLLDEIGKELNKLHRAVILELVLAILRNPKSKSAVK